MKRPKYLYRFRSNVKNAIDEIEGCYVHAADPCSLNDEFEGVLFNLPRIPTIDDNEFEGTDLIRNMQAIDASKIKKRNDLSNTLYAKLPEIRYVLQKDLLIGMREKYASNIGISSFTMNIHNPVMWAIYGDMFRGICIAYDYEEMEKFIDSYENYKLCHVKYGEKIEQQSGFMDYSHKHKEWTHEEEVRLICSNIQNSMDRKIVVPKNAIKAIVFGDKVDEIIIERMRQTEVSIFLKAYSDYDDNAVLLFPIS